MRSIWSIVAEVKIVIPTPFDRLRVNSEGSLKINFSQNVVRLAKVLTRLCYTSTGLGYRDPSLRIGMTVYILAHPLIGLID